MRISEYFHLNKTQFELDFVDIDLNIDLRLFIDPYFIASRNDAFSYEASKTIQSFFEEFICLIRTKKQDEAQELFYYLGEPNETCLGLSKSRPQGRGIGKIQAQQIFKNLSKSKAVKTGLVEDIEDFRIFVSNIDKDKTSDMATNIIRWHLIQYTQKQCKLWGIQLTSNVSSGYFWNRRAKKWDIVYTDMLIIENRKILLIPKGVVSYCTNYTPSKYYDNFVVNYLRNEQLRLNTVLVKRRKNKDKYVTKKSVKDLYPYSKDYLTEFTTKHPEIFEKFKKGSRKKESSLSNEEIINIDWDKSTIIDQLINKLSIIKSGAVEATDYHRTVLGILEFIFYPHLIYPQIETEIHEGRKRIDITFDNAAESGFFYRVHTTYKIQAQFVFVECKNYTRDIQNPELDQIAGRFSTNRGKCGFIVCRSIDDMALFLKRCTDTYKDDRGLIIPIVDEDLIRILLRIKAGDESCTEEFLMKRFREVTLK